MHNLLLKRELVYTRSNALLIYVHLLIKKFFKALFVHLTAHSKKKEVHSKNVAMYITPRSQNVFFFYSVINCVLIQIPHAITRWGCVCQEYN